MAIGAYSGFIHALCTHTHQNHSVILAALNWDLSLPSFHPIFPLLFVTMKLLIVIYYYYDKGHNVLDTMEIFLYVNLIIIRKTYDFYHINTLINLKLPYC